MLFRSNPIAMVGNLTLQDTKMKLTGPLGKDDFPSVLEVELTLKPGRPRDKSDIESMFNGGRGRLYQIPEGFEDILNTKGLEPKTVTAYGVKADEMRFEKAGTSTGKANLKAKGDTIFGSNFHETAADNIKDIYSDGKQFISARFGSKSSTDSTLFSNLSNYTSG